MLNRIIDTTLSHRWLVQIGVIALLGVQWASARAISWNVIVPTLVFNVFGAAVFSLARTYD